jgi:hypothetical protein
MFSNNYDFRLRCYPDAWLFSRQSGIYKWLVEDFNTSSLNSIGINSMIANFLVGMSICKSTVQEDEVSMELKKKCFDLVLMTNAEFLKLLEKESFVAVTKSLYLYLLFLELKKILTKNGFKSDSITRFKLEVDQRTSGLTIAGLLSGSSSMSQEGFLKPSSDLYKIFIDKYSNYFLSLFKPSSIPSNV